MSLMALGWRQVGSLHRNRLGGCDMANKGGWTRLLLLGGGERIKHSGSDGIRFT
jgi:hypothetical protein